METVYRMDNSPYREESGNIFFQDLKILEDLAFIYEKGKKHDTLLLHGEYSFIKEQLSTYKKLGDVRIVRVPQKQYKWLNTCINISASTWCRQAEKFLKTLS